MIPNSFTAEDIYSHIKTDTLANVLWKGKDIGFLFPFHGKEYSIYFCQSFILLLTEQRKCCIFSKNNAMFFINMYAGMIKPDQYNF